MKKISKVMIVFSLAVFLLFANVSTLPAVEAGPFYVGVFGGYVVPGDMEIDDEDNDWYDDDDGEFDIELDESWAAGVKFGYIIPQVRWLAAELEYTYLADQDFDEYGIDGDYSAHNLMANLLFRCPVGKIHPYVGFGVGISSASFDARITDIVYLDSIDEDETAFAAQFIAGVNFEITPHWSTELAYKYFYCEYNIDDFDVEATSHMVTLGVNYHF